MSNSEIEVIKRALEREKLARKQAELILEQKSRNLLMISRELKLANQKLTKLLQEKSSQLQGVFKNINDAYVVIDLSGEVIRMNSIARDLFEHQNEEETLNLYNLIYNKDGKYGLKSLETLEKEGFLSNFISRIYTKSKTIKWIQINASLLYDNKKKPIGAQGIVRDITHIKALEEKQKNILKDLEESNNQLQEYAHIVSHDLKSPLRSLHALTSWIKADNQGNFDKNTDENFALIENTLETMENLISSVLEYSSAGYEDNNREALDLKTEINNLIKSLFVPKHITIKIETELPLIMAERTKMRQVFQNLISNAIKYIDKDKGEVVIAYKERKRYHEFSVKDNGIGIEERYHKKIFNIFQSINKSSDSTGVGLSIVKKIVKLYGGDIWLKSEPNVGSTFYFTLKK